jgi:hypothetical protein
MLINEILTKHYEKLYKYAVNNNKVISQSRTPEDILNDVCLTAMRKYKSENIEENEGLYYLKKNIYNEKHFQYQRKKNELVIYTDKPVDCCYIQDMDF